MSVRGRIGGFGLGPHFVLGVLQCFRNLENFIIVSLLLKQFLAIKGSLRWIIS